MRAWLLGGLGAAALILGACGGGGDDSKPTASLDLNPESTVPSTVAETTATPKVELSTAEAVADKISAAGLGCSDRAPQQPQPVAGFPQQTELVRCTVSGRKAGIAIYSKEGEAEAALTATNEQLCKQIGKTATEKLGIAYGPLYTVGLDNSDPAIAAKIAQATGGQVKRFTCP